MKAFRQVLNTLPFDRLPPRTCEARCLLTHGQDHWGNAMSSFILAKQAGMDVAFQHADQALGEASIYIMHGLNGGASCNRGQWLSLLDKVRWGRSITDCR